MIRRFQPHGARAELKQHNASESDSITIAELFNYSITIN